MDLPSSYVLVGLSVCLLPVVLFGGHLFQWLPPHFTRRFLAIHQTGLLNAEIEEAPPTIELTGAGGLQDELMKYADALRGELAKQGGLAAAEPELTETGKSPVSSCSREGSFVAQYSSDPSI